MVSTQVSIASIPTKKEPTQILDAQLLEELAPSPAASSEENAGEEQALESHEVIELQSFSERKAWIEEKIKFLESLPPIEVFVGLEALVTSSEQVPGIPTRAELQQWMAEHDVIEKEIFIFDTGELTKLRQLTKAATQRNLSPEDTDVIELTLTTIYELDKLLHLLRDRTESLDLLAIRLTWEENRTLAWADRRKLLEDLELFLATRARWSPLIYEVAPKLEDPHNVSRRASITSLASVASVTSDSSLSSAAFSRSARFKLAEVLSRDAALFAGRITTLRHGKIAAAGKALDKLIDNSRKPVPEELLDEQDRLEEQGISDMEYIGKFAMNMVMQWRKADEIYVETIKDQLAAQNLVEEIETAKLHHPTSRQSSSFTSRADALAKRISVRGNPTSSSSSFPRPEHVLFPSQTAISESLAQSLSLEIETATRQIQAAVVSAKEYRETYEAVKHVENILQSVCELRDNFTMITSQLQEGVSGDGDSDGTPVDLMSNDCLDPMRHSVYLALLPSTFDQLEQVDKDAEEVLKSLRLALYSLNASGIDSIFKAGAVSELQELSVLKEKARTLRQDMSNRILRLREARKLWSQIEEFAKGLEEIRTRVAEAIVIQHWRQQSGGNAAPLTPESPIAAPLASGLLNTEFTAQYGDMEEHLSQDISMPLDILCQTLETPLKDFLKANAHLLAEGLASVKRLFSILESIQRQSAAMSSIRDEFNTLSIRMEDSRIQLQAIIDDVLAGVSSDSRDDEGIVVVRGDLELIEQEVKSFMEGLSSRVPFVARSPPQDTKQTSKRRLSDPATAGPLGSTESPIDLVLLDATVRADSNSYALRLVGELETIHRTMTHYDTARLAKTLDISLTQTVGDINESLLELSRWKNTFAQINPKTHDDVGELLQSLVKEVDESASVFRKKISRSFSPLRTTIRGMEKRSTSLDFSVKDVLVGSRLRAVNDAELRFNTWDDGVAALKDSITRAWLSENRRLEDIRLLEAQRMKEDKARRAAEEFERIELEREREEIERRRKIEQDSLEQERQQASERQHAAALAAEALRLQGEKAAAEHTFRMETQRQAEHQLEAERKAADEFERDRLKREGEAMREKLRLIEEQLAEERRLTAERDCIREEERMRAKAAEINGDSDTQGMELVRERRLLATKEQVSASSSEAPPKRTRRMSSHLLSSGNKPSKKIHEVEDDVFGLQVASSSRIQKSQDTIDLQSRVLALRKRLQAMNIHDLLRSSKSTQLPSEDMVKRVNRDFTKVSSDAERLPASVDDDGVMAELKSLRAEIESSFGLVKQIHKLADMSMAVRKCDATLSDLLEHIDSYPHLPSGLMSSSFSVPEDASPADGLLARLNFTKGVIGQMKSTCSLVNRDSRASAERARILRTWTEIEEMANDLLGGTRSRSQSAASSRSSGGQSSSSATKHPGKKAAYHSLSVSSQGHLLAPPHVSSRRAFSGSNGTQSRSSSRMSTISSSTRSVSGPLNMQGSTFASRQRTTSLSNSTSIPARQQTITPLRSLAQSVRTQRAGSPSTLEVSSLSRSMANSSRSSTTSMSTWSRAPRNSLTSINPRVSTPQKKQGPPPRKKYVPDPKNKLDVAVGDVVNQLPVGINIEGVAETWKDQSGKYWIGNQDPKLCFCRILRSQTVMVRVGGGWTELSKFIQDHFAESFRILSESPRPGPLEEKWISSSTLLEAAEIETPPRSPRTPEPTFPFVPSFSLITPSGQSPRSMRSTPSNKGSPLTPLQFMRRAEPDPTLLRPVTPSKPSARGKMLTTTTPAARNSVWRP